MMIECSRCQGQMMLTRMEDFFISIYVWKCLQCGEMIDKTILDNRRRIVQHRINGTPMQGDTYSGSPIGSRMGKRKWKKSHTPIPM